MDIRKRVISIILSLTILVGSCNHAVLASGNKIDGYIEIRLENGENYEVPVKVREDELYLSTEDIEKVTGYVCEIDKNITYIKRDGKEVNTAIYIDFDGKTETMKKQYQLEVVKEGAKYYLPLEEMLYLTHATWCVDNSILYVSQMGKNILDFSTEFLSAGGYDITDKSALYVNSENNLLSAFANTLIYTLRNFDSRIYIPVLGTNSLSDKQYEDALMQLTEEDTRFLETAGVERINQQFQGNLFSQLATDAKHLKFLTDIPKKVSDFGEALEEYGKTNQIARKITDCVDLTDLSSKEIENLSSMLSEVKTVASGINSLIGILETAKMVEKMDEDFMNQLNLLSKVDETKGYYTKSIIKSIKRAAKELNNWVENKWGEIGEDIFIGLASDIGQEATELTFTGQMIAAIQKADKVISVFSKNYSNFMEAHELSYTTKFLIDLETITSMEMWPYYYKVNSQDFTEEELQDFRTYLTMMLKLNMRTQSLVYKIHETTNNNLNWINGSEAKKIQNQIAQSYALICALKSTENMDKRMILEGFENMFSEEEGMTRENIPVSIVYLGTVEMEMEEEMSQDPPIQNGDYQMYVNACKKFMENGAWHEHTKMSMNMKMKSDTSSAKYKGKVDIEANVAGYDEEDLSNLTMTGEYEAKIANQKTKFQMDYADGKVKYFMSEPENTTGEVEIDESFLKFYLFDEEGVSNLKAKDNEISFTVNGAYLDENRVLAIKMLSGISNLNYGDISVRAKINKSTGKLEKMTMQFQAEFQYQGYDAEAEYRIEYMLS